MQSNVRKENIRLSREEDVAVRSGLDGSVELGETGLLMGVGNITLFLYMRGWLYDGSSV